MKGLGIMRLIYSMVAVLAVLAAGSFWNLSQAQMPVGQDKVVAKVDGYEIRMSDMDAARSSLPPQAAQYPDHVITNFLITNLVNARLAAAEARRQGVDKDPALMRRIERTVEQILQNALLQKTLNEKLGEKQIREAYDKMLKETSNSDEVRARHVLVKTEKEALDVIKRAKRGEDFAALAKERSTGPSGRNGGDLGYFTAERMVPAFSAAAFETRPGQITAKPVKTRFGWHVIKVEDRRKVKPPSFKEARRKLRENLEQQVREDFNASLRAKANVEDFGAAGAPPK